MSTHTETLRTSSAEETEALAGRIAGDLRAGDVVVVSGEVGAGKSTFVRGACRALGIEGPVTSPTFTIGRRYEGGRLPVSHLDLYRLETLEGEDPGLLDDYIGPETVTFIEWAAPAEPHLRQPVLRVRLHHAGGDSRLVEIGSTDAAASAQ